MFESLINKPKLKIRFLEKLTFFSFYFTGETWFNENLNQEFELHKTGFAVYMSIANIGNKPTSIDKISLGYKKNVTRRKWFKKNIVWLHQWHSVEDFSIELENDNILVVSNLRIRNKNFENKSNDNLGIGESLVGIAYFEQESAWGNLNPIQNKKGECDIIVKIKDIYGEKYKFKTKIKSIPIEEARKYNPYFGDVQKLMIQKT